MNFQNSHKYLKNLADVKNNILKKSCPKNVILMKTKNNTFLTFLDKMQFSKILCLETYDWFCADGSHIVKL